MLSYYAGSYHHTMHACVSGLKVYKRGYVYWYMHIIASPSEDNVGHVFKVQKSRMMLLHVFVHVHTVCVCGHVCTYIQYVCVAMSMHACVCACTYCMCMCICVCTLHACTSVFVLVSVQLNSHCSCKPYMLVELFNHMTHPEHREQDSWSNTYTATQ